MHNWNIKFREYFTAFSGAPCECLVFVWPDTAQLHSAPPPLRAPALYPTIHGHACSALIHSQGGEPSHPAEDGPAQSNTANASRNNNYVLVISSDVGGLRIPWRTHHVRPDRIHNSISHNNNGAANNDASHIFYLQHTRHGHCARTIYIHLR